MDALKKALGNAPVFVIAYIIFMLPTYFLPYAGSNSSVMHGVDAAAGTQALNFAFWLHMGSLLILCFLCWIRGTYVDKKWLIVFPVLAIAFDFCSRVKFDSNDSDSHASAGNYSWRDWCKDHEFTDRVMHSPVHLSVAA